MTGYLVRRLVSGVAVLAGLVVFAFLATHYIGDPVAFLADPELVTVEEREALREAGGFNRPAWQQLVDYLRDAAQGDLGTSIWQNRAATEVVLERLPATLTLVALAIGTTVLISIPLAVIAARSPKSRLHVAITTVTSVLASLPSFWVLLSLIFLLAVQYRFLPTSGYGFGKEMILPVIALSLAPTGRYTQVLEASLQTEMKRQYVNTARSKGLRERSIVVRHVLRNAAIVAVTLVSAEIIGLLSGAVLIEQVYAWPGVGDVLLVAVERRDLPVVMAAVLLIGVIVVVVNFVVDLLYAYLDPRVRLT